MAIQHKVYFRPEGGDWVYQGQTTGLSWSTAQIGWELYSIYEWRIDSYDEVSELTSTGDTWSFTTAENTLDATYRPRRSDYDEDLGWDVPNGEWVAIGDLDVAGGGSLQSQIVVIGHKTIYFGSL